MMIFGMAISNFMIFVSFILVIVIYYVIVGHINRKRDRAKKEETMVDVAAQKEGE